MPSERSYPTYSAPRSDEQPASQVGVTSASPNDAGPSPAAAAFDVEEMLEEIPGGFDMAVDLASLFLTECPAVLRQIREGLHGENPRLVRRGAHTLKSSAGIFCAHAMVEAAWRLERLASECDCTELKQPYADLEQESSKVMEGLRRLCAGG